MCFDGLPPDPKAAALWWAARGVPVFPCDPKTKKPLTEKGFHNASIDAEQIAFWWTKRPKALIGAPCGKASGLVVVDIDTPGKGENEAPEDVLDEFRGKLDLPVVPTVATMSGGFHLYFKYRPGVKRRIRAFSQIDILGDNGYVILPPSAGYSVICNGELIELPQLEAPKPNGKANGHVDLNGARPASSLASWLEASRQPGRWWASMVAATGHLHTRGTPHDVILELLAAPATMEGYSIEQTRAELATMLRGCKEKVARGVWDKPKRSDVEFPDWAGKKPKGTYANTRIALTSFAKFQFSYERFADRAYYEPGEQITDEVISAMRQLILERYEFDPGLETVFQAARQLAWENINDRVCDWLASLEWDGVERLNSWLADYAGAAETALHAAFGRKTLIAAVRRARQPGCKFDYVLTLQGAQGVGKSSVPRILAGETSLFSDQDIFSMRQPREQQEALQGVWLYEIAEMGGYKKEDINRIKAFVSRTHDRARPVWGKVTLDQPRRNIFIATTNESEPFHDPTGSRRFWPVEIEIVNLEALERDRGQLWAEAAHAEAAGEALTLPPELWGEAAGAQEDRTEAHPWTETLAVLTGSMVAGEEMRVSWAEIWERLNIPIERRGFAARRQVTQIMVKLGWTNPKKALKIDGETARGFVKPA